MKKTMALVLAAVLLLGAAAALAAGLIFSVQVDAKTAAQQALAEQYGFTPAMEAFFDCEVSEDGRTVIFTPAAQTGAGIEGKLGVYTVTLGKGHQATASWSHDGETIGESTQSPVWDTKLLAAAIERKAAGEEWIDIVLDQEQTAVNVTPEEAIEIARRAAAEEFGIDDLMVLEDWGAHLYYRGVEKAEKDGKGAKCYQIRFTQGDERGTEYAVSLYANSGEVFAYEEFGANPDETETYDVTASWHAAPGSEQAKALAEITPEQAMQLAKDAAAEVYGLSPAQTDSMEWIDDVAPSPYAMAEDTPVIQIYLWLWQGGSSAPFAEGNGVYQVDVNAQTGTIESVLYDSTLAGNG
ncbi:MAG: hypothetical protein ACI4MM_00655 [Candidatus Ventricola sp.]